METILEKAARSLKSMVPDKIKRTVKLYVIRDDLFYHNPCFIRKGDNVEGTNKNATQIVSG